MIFFSIIIPTYNRAAFITKAIDSVLAQTYAHWELLIIDDASTDNTTDLLAHYTDPRIRIYRNDFNIERSASRNKGIALAKGEYLCFLDSDDYFLTHHLESILYSIQRTTEKVALFHTGVEQYHTVNNTLKRIERIDGRNPVETVIACHIPVITVAIHHTILKHFQFDSSIHINEDVYLFAQIASRYPLVYIPEVSVVWVLHGNNTTDQERNYWSPQLIALRKITTHPVIMPYVSRTFISERKFDLYSQLLYFYAVQHKYIHAMFFFIKGVLSSPTKKRNWTNLLNVVYHLPGGRLLKKTVATVKHNS